MTTPCNFSRHGELMARLHHSDESLSPPVLFDTYTGAAFPPLVAGLLSVLNTEFSSYIHYDKSLAL